jgi:3-methyladenine DNA glycosylase AlkD
VSSRPLQKWAAGVERDVRALERHNKPPGGAAYVGTDLEYINASTPDLRRLARELDRELPDDWRRCCEALWERPIFEVRVLAILLAVRHRRAFVKGDWAFFKVWLDTAQGWAMVDALTTDLFAAVLKLYPELAMRARAWSKSRNLWLRRASLAVFCRPARDGEFADIAFENLTRLASEKDPMIYKAVSWLLRNYAATHKRRVESFLKEYEDTLHSSVLREVRTKIKTGKKNPNR